MRSPTQRQFEVLDAIRRFGREHGYMPTVRELCRMLGLRSSCTVQRHIEALERKGEITREGNKARSIHVLSEGLPPTSVRVKGGALSDYAGKLGHEVMERLDMIDDDGRVRAGRLWFEEAKGGLNV